jgi:amidase
MLNPYNLKRNTGGSSAGSAASVAANLTMLAVGTDTSTSVRGPAAYNGIVGLRPTTGLISRAGIAPKNLTYDTAGPMARTVTDVAIMLGAMTGVDLDDPKSVETYQEFPDGIDDVPANGLDYTKYLDDKALEGKRLGVMRDFFDGADPEILVLAEEALRVLEEQGAILVDVRIDPEFLEYDIGEDGGSYRGVADYRFYEDFQAYLETLGPDEDVPDTIEEMLDIYLTEVAASDKPAAGSVIRLLSDSLVESTDDPEYSLLLEVELPEA